MTNQIFTIQYRFFKKVKKLENGCWEWIGSKNKKGYGYFKCTSFTKQLAHQVSYILFKGDIPKNCHVCHECDFTSCVNPDHLWIGSAMQNACDMQSKRRDGNRKLTEEDVIAIRELLKTKSQLEIALMYSITEGTVSSISCRRTWKHI